MKKIFFFPVLLLMLALISCNSREFSSINSFDRKMLMTEQEISDITGVDESAVAEFTVFNKDTNSDSTFSFNLETDMTGNEPLVYVYNSANIGKGFSDLLISGTANRLIENKISETAFPETRTEKIEVNSSDVSVNWYITETGECTAMSVTCTGGYSNYFILIVSDRPLKCTASYLAEILKPKLELFNSTSVGMFTIKYGNESINIYSLTNTDGF